MTNGLTGISAGVANVREDPSIRALVIPVRVADSVPVQI